MSQFYLKNPSGASTGPFPPQAILQWIAAGQVTADSTVCAAGTEQWVPITEVPMFKDAIIQARGRGPMPSYAGGPMSGSGPGPMSGQGPMSPSRPPSAAMPMSAPKGATTAVPAFAGPPGSPAASAPKARTMFGAFDFSGAGAQQAIIGRAPPANIVLPYPQVSARHASLAKSPDGMVLITDLGSTNGTHVGGMRIPPGQPVKVKPGDRIFVGPYPLIVALEGEQVSAYIEQAGGQSEWSGNLVEIEALDLFLKVQDRENKAKDKILLNHVTFKAHPGDLIALMGPSGAGKTTLLTVLNGYLRPTSGEVRVNGESLYAIYDALRGSIGYVPQDDIVHPELTVSEAIRYSAKFRLPPDYSEEEINARVEQTIKDLGLEQVKNLEIGKPEKKVLSGGQRKRVNIALELVTDPALMFLDEPTSGLAADDTVALIDLLANLAKKQGKTIIVTIHQPAREEYEKFNLALIMGFGGEPVYYGPSGKESYDFFGRHLAQKGSPPIDNPRDMFDQLKQREEDFAKSGQYPDKPSARLAAAQAWRTEYYRPENPTYQKMYTGSRQPGTPSQSRAPSRGKVPLIRQFWLLLTRYSIVKRRDKAGTIILLAQAPIIGALLALVFGSPAKMPNLWCQNFLQGIENAAAKKGAMVSPQCMQDFTRFTKVADFGGAVFFLAIASLWFGTSNAAREIVSEQAIYRRERMVNLSIFNYVMSKFSLLALLCVVQCTVLLIIVFLSLGLGDYQPEAFFTMLMFMIMTSMCAASIGLLLSTVVTSSEAAMALTPIALIPQVVLGGRMVPMTNKSWLEYVMALMPSRWSFEGLIAAERSELVKPWEIKACIASGEGVSNHKFNCAIHEIAATAEGSGGWGFDTHDQPFVAFGVLAGITFTMVILVMILLRRRDSV